MNVQQFQRKKSFFLVVILAATVLTGIQPVGAQTAACEAQVRLDAINGQHPDQATAPQGFLSTTTLNLTATTSLAGDDCLRMANHPPLLLGAWVSSRLTNPTEEFAYRVTYLDWDNDPPTTITATLDDRLTRPMQRADPNDVDHRDGTVYEAFFGPNWTRDTLFPDAMPGDHFAILHAHDGHHAAQPVRIEGPRTQHDHFGALLAPNPANRLFIHPIANGPTLTPPSEVLPPLQRILGDAPDGAYTAYVEIDPLAAELGASWSVGEGASFQLRRYGLLEGEPGAASGFELLGNARTDPRAYTGTQSVDLAPPATVPDADNLLGGVRAIPESALPFAHVGGVRAQTRADHPDPNRLLRTTIEADLDGDGKTDLCARHTALAPQSSDWTEHSIGPHSPMRMFADACRTDVTPQDLDDGVTSLDDLQDHAAFGLATVLAIHFEALSDSQSQASLLVDNLVLARGFANTNTDIDLCFYGETKPAESPLQPLECVSDIGPHSGTVPAGARAITVWANQMLPQISSSNNFVPKRPYLEPADYGFSLRHSQRVAPAVELPTAPPTGALLLVDDADADGALDETEQILARVTAAPTTASSTLELGLVFDRPDGAYPLLLLYQPASSGINDASLAFTLQRFVNDAPSAGLNAVQHPHPRHSVTFTPIGSDADDAQSETSRRLGGLAHWRLATGDGQPDQTGTWPAPASLEHTYRRHGAYTATFTVWDHAGEQAQAVVELSVGGHPRWSDEIE